jgi:hypothetical protein
MRARWRFVTVAGVILAAACATGGGSDNGGDADLEGPDSSSGMDGPAHHQDGPDSFGDSGGQPKDSGTPVDSTVPPEESSLPDVLPFDVIPFDVVIPKDASADAPFTDAGGGSVNCPLTFKYVLEAEIASESEDPPECSAGCTSTQCCFKAAGICLKK